MIEDPPIASTVARGASPPRATGARALGSAAAGWLAVVVAGQLAFALYILVYFGLSAVHGRMAEPRFEHHGYVDGDTPGNAAAFVHLLFAFTVSAGAALQLVPAVRRRAPALHRWNGRLLVAGGVAASLAGLYLVWVRHAVGDLPQHLGSTLEATLILAFAAAAWRSARARDFVAHRRWALRLFMVLSGVWFFRLGMFDWLALNRGPAGFDPDTFTGPFLTWWGLGSFLLPLGTLEVYFRAESPRAPGGARWATAAILAAGTLCMLAGVVLVATSSWLPRIVHAAGS